MKFIGMPVRGMCGLGMLLAAYFPSRAQTAPDTLRLTAQQAEHRFLSRNLTLLAGHYGVRADSALIRQARLWDNPTLSVDQNVYVEGEGFFRHGTDAAGNPTGQFYVQLAQLIQLGGKRGKAVALAGANAGLSKLQLDETLRNLRRTLREDLLNTATLLQQGAMYRTAFEKISLLSEGMRAQLQAGNISRKDWLRVQALDEGLKLELAENANEAEALQAELRTLLAIRGDTMVLPAERMSGAPPAMPTQSLDELLQIARNNNPAFLIAAKQLDWQKLNYRYQKSLAAPDLSVGPNYDRASNFAPNYFGLTLGLPLPVWNRNQGNIHAADFNVQQQQIAVDAEGLKLENELRAAYRKLALALSLTTEEQQTFYSDYRDLFDKVAQSYRARQISLIEFIDYLNGYEEIQEKQLQQQLKLQLAKEELNYIVGLDVVKP